MSQVVSWYQFTTNCGYTELAEACLNFIKWLLVALRWTIIHRLHLKNQFQVELHSGLHLNRLASPGTWFSSSHPWVQWSCYSGGLSFEIVLLQRVLLLTERNVMWSQSVFFAHRARWLCSELLNLGCVLEERRCRKRVRRKYRNLSPPHRVIILLSL